MLGYALCDPRKGGRSNQVLAYFTNIGTRYGGLPVNKLFPNLQRRGSSTACFTSTGALTAANAPLPPCNWRALLRRVRLFFGGRV
jgi:hypothetical protein